MKLAVLGGGGVRAPMLVSGLARHAQELALTKVVLQDTAAERLSAVSGLARHVLAEAGSPFDLELTESADQALSGADAAFMAIRVGTEEGRVKDEQIALAEGVIGQETTGAGGFAMALRTIPIATQYARLAARTMRPGATLLNFTNPVGIITRAMQHAAPDLRIIGLCDTPSGMVEGLETFLGASPGELEASYVGLNHLGWVHGVRVQGKDVMPDLLDRAEELIKALPDLAFFPPALLRELKLLPNEYCYHYYFPEDSLAHLQSASELRSEQVRRLNRKLIDGLLKLGSGAAATAGAEAVYKEVFGERHRTYMAMETGTGDRPSDPAHLFDGGGYQSLAIGVLAALRRPRTQARPLILDVAAGDHLPGYAPDDVVEITCLVSKDGIEPRTQNKVPAKAAGLMAAVAAYERLTVEAATKGDRSSAIAALTTHPLVGSYPKARRLVDAYLTAHAAFLPQFRS